MKNFRRRFTKYGTVARIYSTEKEEMDMEHETLKEARVWQRVHSEKQAADPVRQTENLSALILEQTQLSAAYRQLAGRMQGQDGTMLIRLARESNMQVACLKGIATLMNGFAPQGTSTTQLQSNTDAILRRCYGTQLRLLKIYESRIGDAEYGPVFERMAARGREHCYVLLELIGKTGKTKG